MKTNIMTSVVAGLLLACAGLANAAEPVALTDSQMDSVAAGTATTAVASSSATAYGGLAVSASNATAVSFGRYHAANANTFTLAFGRARATAYARGTAY
jgi:hypothetical protein